MKGKEVLKECDGTLKKWMTFDLDETLIKNPFEKWVFPEIKALLMDESDINIVRTLVSRHKALLEDEAYAAAYNWDEILQEVLTANNIPIHIDIETLVKKHAVVPKVYLLEDNIKETLLHLKECGFSLAVITNGLYKYQFPVLEALGIAGLFEEIITPTETGTGKPDMKMVEKLLGTGELIAHVGDRLDHDVSFSNQLGALSVLIDKNMPADIKTLLPEARNQALFYSQRWKEFVSEDYCPRAIIYSINELRTLNADLMKEGEMK